METWEKFKAATKIVTAAVAIMNTPTNTVKIAPAISPETVAAVFGGPVVCQG